MFGWWRGRSHCLNGESSTQEGFVAHRVGLLRLLVLYYDQGEIGQESLVHYYIIKEVGGRREDRKGS